MRESKNGADHFPNSPCSNAEHDTTAASWDIPWTLHMIYPPRNMGISLGREWDPSDTVRCSLLGAVIFRDHRPLFDANARERALRVT